MRGLFALILTLCLFAGLATGAVAHAAELSGNGEVAAAAEWLHAEGDHDQVPGDADKNVPHHHSICHGHDLAAPMKAGAAPTASCALMPRLATHAAPPGTRLAALLRPPIA